MRYKRSLIIIIVVIIVVLSTIVISLILRTMHPKDSATDFKTFVNTYINKYNTTTSVQTKIFNDNLIGMKVSWTDTIYDVRDGIDKNTYRVSLNDYQMYSVDCFTPDPLALQLKKGQRIKVTGYIEDIISYCIVLKNCKISIE